MTQTQRAPSAIRASRTHKIQPEFREEIETGRVIVVGRVDELGSGHYRCEAGITQIAAVRSSEMVVELLPPVFTSASRGPRAACLTSGEEKRKAARLMVLVWNGQQRGSSRREDLLNVVISLSRPSDYREQQGARFVATFKKAAGFAGLTQMQSKRSSGKTHMVDSSGRGSQQTQPGKRESWSC